VLGYDVCYSDKRISHRLWFDLYHGVGHGTTILTTAQRMGANYIVNEPHKWQLEMHAFPFDVRGHVLMGMSMGMLLACLGMSTGESMGRA
jgi:hypothetical protein